MDPPVQLHLVGGVVFVGETAQPGDPRPEPCEGMEFDSYEEAFAFYIAYGRREGFRVSTKSSRRSKKDNDYVEAKLVCWRSGKKIEKPQALYRRRSSKIGCNAAMHVRKRDVDKKWFVYHFVKEHNHELARGSSRLIRSQAEADSATPADGIGRALCAASGAKRSRILAEMGRKGCIYENAGRAEEGLGNGLERERHFSLEEGHARVLLDFFTHMQKVNPSFLYTLDLDDQQRLKNVFWVDSKGRHDYISFGDAVSVDTMYITIKYKVLFSAVSGLNHHGQQLLFGCAILSDETTATFVWLMKSWLKAVGGKVPQTIITDQDEALKSAIKRALPNSKHRFCIWDIKRKISEKLGHFTCQHKNFIDEFSKCVFKSRTDKEFETRWDEMIDKFELQENDWLKKLYEDRKYWIPIFLKETLSVGLSSSQRIENINFLFDKPVSRRCTLKEFLKRYEDALNDRCEKEAKADFETWHSKPTLKSPSPYEMQASLVYTRYVFEKFQAEVMGTRACHVFREKEDGQTVTFCVKDLEQDEEFIVTWNGAESKISCLCCSFEFYGYLCRHAMIAFQFSGVSKLPSPYILKRWTKDAKCHLTLCREPDAVTSRLKRFNDLCQQAIRLANEASLTQESYNISLFALEEVKGKYANVVDSHVAVANPTHFNN
uniref:Protein FAR1-RELATED SEQUENCE n=1 Tax=Anthurium amnicola TaxID=1678845 RepID=A0A1D1XHS0_9ARAE